MVIKNKKTIIVSITASLIAVVSSILAFNHLNDSYSGDKRASTWMSEIDDSKQL